MTDVLRGPLFTGTQCISSYKNSAIAIRKQIARQLRTQYVEDIYRPNYPRDLEIQDKAHVRSLETEPLDRSYTTYYKSSYLTLNIVVTLKYGLEVTQSH